MVGLDALVCLPFLLVFSRFERPGESPTGRRLAPAPRLRRGLRRARQLALGGVGGDGWLGLRWIPLLLPLVGAGLAGFGPLGRIPRRAS